MVGNLMNYARLKMLQSLTKELQSSVRLLIVHCSLQCIHTVSQ